MRRRRRRNRNERERERATRDSERREKENSGTASNNSVLLRLFLVQPIIVAVVESVHKAAAADRERVIVLVSVESTQLIMGSMTLFTWHHPTEGRQLTMIFVARHQEPRHYQALPR